MKRFYDVIITEILSKTVTVCVDVDDDKGDQNYSDVATDIAENLYADGINDFILSSEDHIETVIDEAVICDPYKHILKYLEKIQKGITMYTNESIDSEKININSEELINNIINPIIIDNCKSSNKDKLHQLQSKVTYISSLDIFDILDDEYELNIYDEYYDLQNLINYCEDLIDYINQLDENAMNEVKKLFDISIDTRKTDNEDIKFIILNDHMNNKFIKDNTNYIYIMILKPNDNTGIRNIITNILG